MRLLTGILLAAALFGQTTPADDLLKQGLALGTAERFEEAARVFEEGRRRFPDDSRFPLELAGVEYRQHDTGRAKSYLREALRDDPNDQYGNEFLASIYMLDGNLPAAVKYWNRVGRPVIGEVRFLPMPPLDPVLLRRAVAVSGGQLLTLTRLELTQSHFDRLRIFSDYQLELTPRADDKYDLTIRTVARAGQTRRWWWRLLPFLGGLPYQQINADFYNLRQNATNVVSMWRWDANKRRIALELTGPVSMSRYRIVVDGRDERWDLRRTARAEDGGLNGVILRRLEAGAEVTFGIGDRILWTPGLWASRREFRNGNGSPFFVDAGLAEIRNRFDALMLEWPDERVRVQGWAMLRTGQLFAGGHSRFLSPQAGISARWFPQDKGNKYEVRARFRAGGIFGRATFDEMFMLGMERDNDLWLRGHVGTRDGRKGNAPLGSRYFLVNLDFDRAVLRIPFMRVSAGPFFDFGRIGDPSSVFGSRGLLYDTGLQVKVAAPGGVTVSAVYGRDLRDGRPAFYTAVSR